MKFETQLICSWTTTIKEHIQSSRVLFIFSSTRRVVIKIRTEKQQSKQFIFSV